LLAIGVICTILAYLLTDPVANAFVVSFSNTKFLTMAIGLADVAEFKDMMR
jgi:hypothetical protein